jgi:hypothetical protein
MKFEVVLTCYEVLFYLPKTETRCSNRVCWDPDSQAMACDKAVTLGRVAPPRGDVMVRLGTLSITFLCSQNTS